MAFNSVCAQSDACENAYLGVCVVLDITGRDQVTDGIRFSGHFLFDQQRQIHNLKQKKQCGLMSLKSRQFLP